MKKTIVIMTLQILSACLMADETEVIRQTSQLLTQLKNKMPENWDISCYVDNYLIWRETPEFDQLKNFMSEHWKYTSENITEVAPSEIHQLILFASFCSLPLNDSFRCLDKMTDLCLDNVIRKEMFHWVVSLYEVYTMPAHRLALNYQNPTVAEILRKAKIIAPERTGHYNKMLSGEEKNELAEEGYLDFPVDGQATNMVQETTFEKVQQAIVIEKLGANNVPVADGRHPNEATELKSVSWKTLLFIGVIIVGIIIGVGAAWRCFKKRKKN